MVYSGGTPTTQQSDKKEADQIPWTHPPLAFPSSAGALHCQTPSEARGQENLLMHSMKVSFLTDCDGTK